MASKQSFVIISVLFLAHSGVDAKNRKEKISQGLRKAIPAVIHFITTPPIDLLFPPTRYVMEPSQKFEQLLEQTGKKPQEPLEDVLKSFDVPKLRAHLATLNLTPQVLRAINAELDNCAAAGSPSPYLTKLLSLPWGKESVDNLDLDNAKKVLDENHYGLDQVKEKILDFMARLQFAPDGKAPILCLVGPPGVGKTTLCKPIAQALGRSYVHKALGGQWGEHVLRGFHRTWLGAQPGALVEALIEAQTMNPVIVLDEVDKLGCGSNNGDPAAALLEVLDPAQNSMFRDNYITVPVNLSHVFFMVTANDRSRIPAALQSRLHIIELPGYTVQEKIRITQKHLIPQAAHDAKLDNAELLKAKGFNPAYIKLQFTQDALMKLATVYSPEEGVRIIKQHLETIVSKIMRNLLREPNKATFKLEPIDAKMLTQLLGVAE